MISDIMNKKKLIMPFLYIIALLVIPLVPGSVNAGGLAPVGFSEVWGYLMRGDEKRFRGNEPVTDICCFSVGVGYKGRLTSFAAPPSLHCSDGIKRRVHIVVAILENEALTHYCLEQKYGMRDGLVADIVRQSESFDGVQIDFEAVPDEDGALFADFLLEIKNGLGPGKTLSVALPARKSRVKDGYDYSVISSIADRIMVMAYDQHWSSSSPGPVASLGWCRDVAEYSRSVVPAGKLIMGLPLYGRSWQKNGHSRAVRWNDFDALLSRDDATFEYSVDTGWIIRCDEKVAVVAYFDDITATREKLSMYRGYTGNIAFWRLGMEKGELWSIITIEPGNSNNTDESQ